jgi:hypothetical protein
MSKAFDSGERTYYVSDERLRAFMALTPEQRLRWVEEISTFLRLAKIQLPDSTAGKHTDRNVT